MLPIGFLLANSFICINRSFDLILVSVARSNLLTALLPSDYNRPRATLKPYACCGYYVALTRGNRAPYKNGLP